MKTKSFQPDKNNMQEMNLYKALPNTYKWADIIMMWYRNAYKTGHRDDSAYIATQLENVRAMIEQYESAIHELQKAKQLKPTYTISRPYRAEGTVEVDPLNLAKIRSYDGFKNLKTVIDKALMSIPNQKDVSDQYFKMTTQDMLDIGIVDFDDKVVMWRTKGFDTTNRFIYRFQGVGRENFKSALARDSYCNPKINSPYCTRVKGHWDVYSRENPEYQQFWFMLKVPDVEYKKGDLTDPAVYDAFMKSTNSGPKSICAMCGSYNDWCDRVDDDLSEADCDIFDASEDGYVGGGADDDGNIIAGIGPLDFNGAYDNIVDLISNNTTISEETFYYPWEEKNYTTAKSHKFDFIKLTSGETGEKQEYDPSKEYNGNIFLNFKNFFQIDKQNKTFTAKFELPSKINGTFSFHPKERTDIIDDTWKFEYPYNKKIIDVTHAKIYTCSYNMDISQTLLDFFTEIFNPTTLTVSDELHDNPTGKTIFKSELAHFGNIKNINLEHVTITSLKALPRSIPGNLVITNIRVGNRENTKIDISDMPREIGWDLRIYRFLSMADANKLPYIEVHGKIDFTISHYDKTPLRILNNRNWEAEEECIKQIFDYNKNLSFFYYIKALEAHDIEKFKDGFFDNTAAIEHANRLNYALNDNISKDITHNHIYLFKKDCVLIYDGEKNSILNPNDNDNLFKNDCIRIDVDRLHPKYSFKGMPVELSEICIYVEDNSCVIDIPYKIKCQQLRLLGNYNSNSSKSKISEQTYKAISENIESTCTEVRCINMSDIPEISFNTHMLAISASAFNIFSNMPNIKKISLFNTKCKDLTNIPASAELEILQKLYESYKIQNLEDIDKVKDSMCVQKLIGCPTNIKKIKLRDYGIIDAYKPAQYQVVLNYLNGIPYFPNMEITANVFRDNTNKYAQKIIQAYTSGDKKYFDADMRFNVESMEQLENLQESEEIEEYVRMFGRFLRG